MPAMTRGPLPAGVYWRRRLFVGALALALVFVLGSWLTNGSDGTSEEPPVAQQAGAVDEATHTVTAEPLDKENTQAEEQEEPALAPPTGTCAAADVVVTPVVAGAAARQPVTVTLSLQTRTVEACTWRVGPKKVAIKISGAAGEVWSTRHCKAVPGQNVVVRRAVATEVAFTWNARRSDTGCPKKTAWAAPGELTIAAAALGGEPERSTFALAEPTAAEPKAEKLKAKTKKGNALDRIDQR